MPCDSSYLERTGIEAELQHTAWLYAFVLRELGLPVPADVKAAAASYYGGGDYVPALCARLRILPCDELDKLLTQRNKESRALANWWEDHQAADAQREHREQEEARRKQLTEQAIAKLTTEELEALRKSKS